jgi:ABC-2 type transport system ATP-binding protein
VNRLQNTRDAAVAVFFIFVWERSMLEAAGLSKKYGSLEALSSLDLKVEAGEIFCLLGANGAGKTTTINLFMNFITPSGGKALIDGKDVTEHPRDTKQQLAYIPEQVSFYEQLTGLENLQFFCEVSGKRHSRSDYLEVLEQAGLDARAADRRVSTYSKGMRQKIGIAIALAKKAKVLLLDEPTSGLDPKASNDLAANLAMLREMGAAILMATHAIFRARETGSRVGIMKHGKLVDSVVTSSISAPDLEALYLEHMHD